MFGWRALLPEKWVRQAAPAPQSQASPRLNGNAPASTTPHVSTPAAPSVPPQRTTGDKPPTVAQAIGAFQVEELRHPLNEQVELHGETYHIEEITRALKAHKVPITAKESTLKEVPCVLVPEHWNEDDANAVAVRVGVHYVGYIPADMAAQYSPALLRLAESGTLVSGLATIRAKSDDGVVRARVTVQLPEATAFA